MYLSKFLWQSPMCSPASISFHNCWTFEVIILSIKSLSFFLSNCFDALMGCAGWVFAYWQPSIYFSMILEEIEVLIWKDAFAQQFLKSFSVFIPNFPRASFLIFAFNSWNIRPKSSISIKNVIVCIYLVVLE